MLLSELLNDVKTKEIIGSTEVMIEQVQFDSRKVEQNTLFVAQTGTQVDGHDFIHSSIEAGAIAVVCERKPESLNENVTYVIVDNSAITLGIIAANFYQHPTKKLKHIGITGNNGKTKTAIHTYNLL